MKIEKANIKKYIPQREPFIMIDALIDATNEGFRSEFEIVDSNCLLINDVLSESALVENIAQTCAAGFGYLNSLIEDSEPRLGFIGAVTKLINFKSAVLHQKIDTTVSILNTFENIHLIQGTCFVDEVKLLECQMKIVLA
jgi:3-hydroxyacyl-[acyl-carrier-protein] dehydratase